MLSQTDFVIAFMQEEQLLTPEGLERATRYAMEQHTTLAEATIALGIVSARDLAVIRAVVSETPFLDLSHYEIDLSNSELLPRSSADSMGAFPLFNLGRTVVVGMIDPLAIATVDRLRSLLRCDVEPVLCEPSALRLLIERAYSLSGNLSSAESEPGIADASSGSDEEPIVAAVNQIIIQALDQGASDVHLGPDEHTLHLRYRIDGALQVRQGPSLASHPGLVQRLKVMAQLDLTQTRRPQDGKFRFQSAGRPVDVRVSIIPTVAGENVVLRLLSSGPALGSLEQLGLSRPLCTALESLIRQPHGMILSTGPTGSGKSTTLYSLLSRLNTPERNILTIEDPVEVRLPMVRQVQVNADIGMTFAGALRALLRQDPDVILVGEIRDDDTARIAVQAALTGHLVLSTLHTNDAAGAVARLRDLGCPSFAINAAVLCVLAQRLVRRICPECARPDVPDASLLRRVGTSVMDGRFQRGAGCARCMNTGYRGRTGIYELLRMTPAIQQAVEEDASTAAFRAIAEQEGLRPLWQDGLDKAKLGITTIEEVIRVAAARFDSTSVATEIAA